ncbi:ComF family protein [Alkaliphilus peptidifermentans]|nr:ComF family protein [Alkaliphilus peptidifermentans]
MNKINSFYVNYIKAYGDAFWEIIYPEGITCVICKKSIYKEKYSLCKDCYSKIAFLDTGIWIQTSAIREAIPIRIFSVVKYNNASKKIIYRLKYNQETFMARMMAEMMMDYILKAGIMFNCIVAVPLHKKREKERGFNQAYLLAKYLSKGCNIPCIKNNLIRIRDTKVMHHLSRQSRQKNVEEAFYILDPVEFANKEILLIDDIVTTGATVEACCKILIEAGASSVKVLTLARRTKEEGKVWI